MADLDADAERAQALHIGAVGDIAALHLIAEVVQNLGDAAHADAADADEMQRADVERNGPHAAFSWAGGAAWPFLPSMVAMTRSASARAAWGRPSAWDAAAARASIAGAAMSSASRSARASGVKAACGITQAPPACSSARAFAVW